MAAVATNRIRSPAPMRNSVATSSSFLTVSTLFSIVTATFILMAAVLLPRQASQPEQHKHMLRIFQFESTNDRKSDYFDANTRAIRYDLRKSRASLIFERFLLSSNDSLATNHTPIDDDATREDICRDYIISFFNESSDSKDICQAMLKAYQNADCKDFNSQSNTTSDTNNNSDFLFTHHSFESDVIRSISASEYWNCCSSTSDYYEKYCQEKSPFDASKLLGIVFVLILCGGMKSLLRIANIQYIPDAGVCIIVGASVGGFLRLIQSHHLNDKFLAYNNDLFLQIMLPPIVFEAALSMEKRAFRRDLFPILTFAVAGTFMSALGIALITFHLSQIHGGEGLPWIDSLLFGSLMSSIDPVATLGILSSVGVNQGDTLYTLIFGESLLNDGVSIVLFESFLRYMGDGDVVDRATVQDVLCHFLLVTLASIATGVICGGIAALYFYALRGKQKAVGEVAMFCAWALVPYYIADGLGYSGIIAIMVMGFMMDFYVFGGHQSVDGDWLDYIELNDNPDFTPHPVEPYFVKVKAWCTDAFSGKGLILSKSRTHVGFVASVLSTIMETAIFCYLGLFLFNDRIWNFGLTFSGLLACIASRAGMVILLSLLINVCVWIDLERLLSRLCKYCSNQRIQRLDSDDDSIISGGTRVYLDIKTQLILFSAGVRGAVSYALVQSIPDYDAVSKHGSHFKDELRSMTSAIIVLLLFTLGALTYFTVHEGSRQHRDQIGGNFTRRLLSSALDSNDGQEDFESDMNSTFEIDGRLNQPRRLEDGQRV